MSKVVYILLKYSITAAGASLVTWTDDVLTQLSAAIVTVAGVLFASWRQSKGIKD